MNSFFARLPCALLLALTASTAFAAESTSFVGELLRMVLALVIVLMAMVLSLYLVKRFKQLPMQPRRLKIVEQLGIGSRERLAIVAIDDEELLIAICAENISLLTKLPRPTLRPTPSEVVAEQSTSATKSTEVSQVEVGP